MTIPYFGPNQNLVFVPALLVLLAATVVICLPIVFAPALRRSPRRAPVLALVVVVAVVALVGTGLLAAKGFTTLGAERAAVQSWIARTYGIRLDGGAVGELVDGGKPPRSPDDKRPLELKPTVKGGDVYELYLDKKPVPAS